MAYDKFIKLENDIFSFELVGIDYRRNLVYGHYNPNWPGTCAWGGDQVFEDKECTKLTITPALVQWQNVGS